MSSFASVSLSQKLCTVTGIAASVYAFLLNVLPWDTFATLYPSFANIRESNDVRLFATVTLFGWVAGKFAATLSGPKASTMFAKFNVVPTFLHSLLAYSTGSWDLPLWIAICGAYIYVGFVVKETKKKAE